MRVVLGLSCALAVVGCRDAGASSGRMDAGTRAQPRVKDAGISLSGGLYEYAVLDVGGPGVGGAEVCQDEPRLCTTTDSEGRFTLSGLSPEREIVITYRKAGFVPVLQPLVTPRWSSMLQWTQLLADDFDLSGFNVALRAVGRRELDLSNRGLPSVLFSAFSGAVDIGVTPRLHVRLDPDSGSEPFYFLDPSGEITVALTSGQSALYGVFLNLEPREDYELVYEHDDGDCVFVPGSRAGWPSAQGRPNATRVPVRDGYITYTTMQFCPIGLETDAD